MSADRDLLFVLSELVDVFGPPLAVSVPDLADYWFSYQRADGLSVTLTLSGYERTAGVIVRCSNDVACGSVSMGSCDVVRVLEPSKRTLELVSQDPPLRCFVALDGDLILDVQSEVPLR